jgi:hypothetical protein
MPDITKGQSQETNELLVYSSRSHLVKRGLFFLVLSIVYTFFSLFFLYLFVELFSQYKRGFSSTTALLQLVILAGFLLTLMMLVLVLLTTISLVRRFISREPALRVNLQGVHLRDLQIIGNVFFPWHEIASLSIIPVNQSLARPAHYFCLDMKDRHQFLLRFHPVQQVLMKVQTSRTRILISMPQWLLAEPMENTLLFIQEAFQREIQASNIQIWDMRVRKGTY